MNPLTWDQNIFPASGHLDRWWCRRSIVFSKPEFVCTNRLRTRPLVEPQSFCYLCSNRPMSFPLSFAHCFRYASLKIDIAVSKAAKLRYPQRLKLPSMWRATRLSITLKRCLYRRKNELLVLHFPLYFPLVFEIL